MRIGIDGRYIADHYPGIGRYTYSLIRAMACLAPDDEFVLPVAPEGANTRYDLTALGRLDNVELVPLASSTMSLAQFRTLARLASAQRLDLFHSPSYALPLGLRCPTLVTVHDLIPRHCPETLPGARERAAYRALMALAMAGATRILVDTEVTRADVLRFYGRHAAKTRVVPLGVGREFRSADAGEPDEVLARLGVRRPYVLYVGINKPHKNLRALLEAWGALSHSARGEHVLVWAGAQDPRFPDELRLVDDGAGDVLALGPVSEADLPALYRGATCFVFPSLCEGYGLPILEAMASGTPVVCADASCMPQVAGGAAVLFDPFERGGLLGALELVLENGALRRELAARGLVRARAHTWERAAEATLAVYREMLKDR